MARWVARRVDLVIASGQCYEVAEVLTQFVLHEIFPRPNNTPGSLTSFGVIHFRSRHMMTGVYHSPYGRADGLHQGIRFPVERDVRDAVPRHDGALITAGLVKGVALRFSEFRLVEHEIESPRVHFILTPWAHGQLAGVKVYGRA